MATRRAPSYILTAAIATVLAIGLAVPAQGAPNSRSVPIRTVTPSSTVHADDETGEVDSDEAESVELRGEYQQSITAAPATVAPADGLLAAQNAGAGLPTYRGRWTEETAKPFVNDPIDRGQNYGVGWGDVTGRMTALTHSGSIVYAASASGGVWRSTNLGLTWFETNDGLPRLSIGALATNPFDGSVWAGTGEANNASENQYGVGVYRLARGSNVWQLVGSSELNGAGSYRIQWIGRYVYIATSHGLYRRPDRAPSSWPWQVVLQPSGNVSYPPTSSVTDVIPVPGTHGRQILAVVGWAGYSTPPATENNGFYVGSGARGSFTRITVTGDIVPGEIGRTSFSSAGGRLYAVIEDSATDSLDGQGVFVSRSGHPAGPWTRIADVNKLVASGSALGPVSSGYFPGVQSDYNQYILADPANPQHLYLGLEEVFESTNGGQSWNAVGPYWNFDISCDTTDDTPYNCPGTTHPDQHAAMIYNDQFWGGSDGGVWRRPLSVHVRGSWTNLNATLHTTQNYSIAVGAVPGHSAKDLAYWGGLQDNGESYTRNDLTDVEQAFTGDGGDTIVDPGNGNRAVEEYVYDDMFLTTDAAVTAREISPSCLSATDPPPVCDPNPRFIAPIEMDVTNSNHWITGGQYVWDDTKSWNTVCDGTDGVCDWKKVYDTGATHQVTALADNGAVTYAAWCGSCNPPAFSRGLATNYGGTWHELSLAGVPSRYITSIAVDPSNAAHVYLSLGSYSRRWIPDAGIGHVYESINGGATWRDVSGSLPDAPVYKVAFAGHDLVAGTEVGAFIAGCDGRSPLRWARLGTNLPNVTVWDVTVASGNRVIVGTHGRGDWQITLTH